MSESLIFKPHPGAQTKFMAFTGRYALIGGAAGGGKTDCLRFDPFRQIAVETERYRHGEIRGSSGRAILFRRTMPELREVMDRCRRDFEAVAPGVRWHENDKTWTFPCGYKFMFGQMEEDKDWIKYHGFEFTWAGFDELTTFTEEQFEMIDTRVRSTDPVLSKMLAVRAGTNPVGIGLEWVRRRFVECAPPGTPVIRRVPTPVTIDGVTHTETVEHRQIFIPAKLADNPSIDQAQYAATLVTKSSATKRALLDGDWYVSQGALLADLWDQSIHVCEPFKVPAGWYRFRSGDYGYTNPSSVSWYAVDPDGNFVCYRNLTVTRHNAEMLAYRIKEIEIEDGYWDPRRNCSMLTGPLDYECWSQRGTLGPTIAETMAEVGVFWDKCTKDRHAAADQVRSRLLRRTGHPTLKDKHGKPLMNIPGIRWFKTCTAPIRSLPVLPCDKNDPDVPDTDANDHNYDDFSYACMSRPIVPPRSRDPEMDFFLINELEKARRKRMDDQTRGSRTGYRGSW